MDPSMEERAVHGGARVALIAAAVVVALSSFYAAPKLADRLVGTQATAGPGVGATPDASGRDSKRVTSTQTGGSQTDTKVTGPGDVPPPGLTCTGNNGGRTDVGVDAKNIYLAATEVQSGIGQSFLGPVHYGIQAVLQKTNAHGGVCGRQLQLVLKDDGWRPDLGKQFIDNFIDGNQYFALAVVPSSNGLDAASEGGDLDKASDPLHDFQGIPVVGTDGMLNSQYADPMIWPVAASTATSMRIMAHDAVNRWHQRFPGQKLHMAIVYDQNYPFGPEGAGAFVAQAKRDGVDVPCQVPLTAGESSYGTQAKQFNDQCGEGTQNQAGFVALLLEPQTAETWLRAGPYLGTPSNGQGLGFGGPQPLFDKNFGDQCGNTCQNMQVWTSFYPPIYPFSSRDAVQQFKQDLCQVDNNCEVDSLSAFTESGYVGMALVVKALQDTSPFLTRQRLAATLDRMSFGDGLSAQLSWKPGYHFANQSMTAFVNRYSSGASTFSFDPQSGEQTDPCPGCHDAKIG
jgi:ABC-type branched-subunit amino acid transport system substrate-binding protein